MRSKYGNVDSNKANSLHGTSSSPPTKIFEGEGFAKFMKIHGIENLVDDCDKSLEDDLKRRIEETFLRAKECVEKHIYDSQDGRNTPLQTRVIAEVFRSLFNDDSDEACLFLESRFYYGSQAPSPIDRLNLACKDGKVEEHLTLIRQTFDAVERGAFF